MQILLPQKNNLNLDAWQDFVFGIKDLGLCLTEIGKGYGENTLVEINTTSEQEEHIISLMQLCFGKTKVITLKFY